MQIWNTFCKYNDEQNVQTCICYKYLQISASVIKRSAIQLKWAMSSSTSIKGCWYLFNVRFNPIWVNKKHYHHDFHWSRKLNIISSCISIIANHMFDLDFDLPSWLIPCFQCFCSIILLQDRNLYKRCWHKSKYSWGLSKYMQCPHWMHCK